MRGDNTMKFLFVLLLAVCGCYAIKENTKSSQYDIEAIRMNIETIFAAVQEILKLLEGVGGTLIPTPITIHLPIGTLTIQKIKSKGIGRNFKYAVEVEDPISTKDVDFVQKVGWTADKPGGTKIEYTLDIIPEHTDLQWLDGEGQIDISFKDLYMDFTIEIRDLALNVADGVLHFGEEKIVNILKIGQLPDLADEINNLIETVQSNQDIMDIIGGVSGDLYGQQIKEKLKPPPSKPYNTDELIQSYVDAIDADMIRSLINLAQLMRNI